MPNPHPDYYELAFASSALGGRIAAIEKAVPVGSTILDLGCNDGRISRHLLDVGLATRVLGIDICRVVDARPSAFTFVCADLASLDPACLEPVDVVLLLNIVHHLVAESRQVARTLIDHLLGISSRILCDIGSFSERGDWTWRRQYEKYWRSDTEMWDDLFKNAPRRTPLLRYDAQTGGHRVLWQLETGVGRP
jgi:SAM-dependent methyltransferase